MEAFRETAGMRAMSAGVRKQRGKKANGSWRLDTRNCRSRHRNNKHHLNHNRFEQPLPLPKTKLPSANALFVFEAAARCGTFTRAAPSSCRLGCSGKESRLAGSTLFRIG
jgi:hypothetical protein